MPDVMISARVNKSRSLSRCTEDADLAWTRFLTFPERGNGKFIVDPEAICDECFPRRPSITPERVLSFLVQYERERQILVYTDEVDGQLYGVVNFDKWQDLKYIPKSKHIPNPPWQDSAKPAVTALLQDFFQLRKFFHFLESSPTMEKFPQKERKREREKERESERVSEDYISLPAMPEIHGARDAGTAGRQADCMDPVVTKFQGLFQVECQRETSRQKLEDYRTKLGDTTVLAILEECDNARIRDGSITFGLFMSLCRKGFRGNSERTDKPSPAGPTSAQILGLANKKAPQIQSICEQQGRQWNG